MIKFSAKWYSEQALISLHKDLKEILTENQFFKLLRNDKVVNEILEIFTLE